MLNSFQILVNWMQNVGSLVLSVAYATQLRHKPLGRWMDDGLKIKCSKF